MTQQIGGRGRRISGGRDRVHAYCVNRDNRAGPAMVRGYAAHSASNPGVQLKDIVVVILSWNKKHAVIDCIGRAQRLSGANVHVVVVDNASSDDSVDAIRSAHPNVTVLAEASNTGFAGGVNRGLTEAARRGAHFAWLLNDDTSFDSTVLAPLLAYADAHPRCGLMTPMLIDLEAGASVQFVNGMVDWRRGTIGHNFPPEVMAARIAEGATPTVVGTALLVDMKLYRSIGPFDERFFAYWEDTDYAIRAARGGFDTAIVTSTQMAHAAPPPTERPPHYHYYMTRNEALFWKLHATVSTRWRRRWFVAALDSIGRQRDLDHPANVQAIIDGLWHTWTCRYHARAIEDPAPRWFHRLLNASPYLWSSVLQGHWLRVVKRALRIRQRTDP